tara:strand:+ start:552 stop:2024 length:1473 start_codon:yes stop_codon:yes gene_type:complete
MFKNISNVLAKTDSVILRFIYDLLVVSYITSTAIIYYLVNKIEFDFQLFLAVPLILSLNYVFGVYNIRHKYSISRKIFFLLLSLFITFALVSFNISNPLFKFSEIYFFSFLAMAPLLIIPRVMLGLQFGQNKKIFNAVSKNKGPILIVGGAGYIGTCVVELLLLNNYKVRVLDKLMYGRESLNSLKSNNNLEIVEGDATNISILTECMIDASAVIHLAGLVGDPACSVNENYTRHTNIITTRMVKDLVIALEIPRLIFASSCSVYGSNDNFVNEDSPLNPVSLYAQTKIDSEKELLSFTPDFLTLTCLRFATVFGHSERPRFDLVANLFCAAAIQEGSFKVIGPKQYRPFIHVRDLARSILITLKASKSIVRNQIFNVGDDRMNITIGELGQKVFKLAKKYRNDLKIEVINDLQDKRNYYVSFNKIKKYLDFDAKYDLDYGIEEMLSKVNDGKFNDFKSDKYNNVVVTKKQIDRFENPLIEENLYTSLKS